MLLTFDSDVCLISHRVPDVAVWLSRVGVNVVLVSYRGYGASTGSPSEVYIKEMTTVFIRVDVFGYLHPFTYLFSLNSGQEHITNFPLSLQSPAAVGVSTRGRKRAIALVEGQHVLNPICRLWQVRWTIWLIAELILLLHAMRIFFV